MATFIATVHFTEQGMRNAADSVARAAAFKTAVRKLGVKVTDQYWTLGPFDGLLVREAPAGGAVTAAMLPLSAQGNVRTQTAGAFDAAEMQKVLGLLPK